MTNHSHSASQVDRHAARRLRQQQLLDERVVAGCDRWGAHDGLPEWQVFDCCAEMMDNLCEEPPMDVFLQLVEETVRLAGGDYNNETGRISFAAMKAWERMRASG